MRVRIPPSPPNKVKGPVLRQALLLYPVTGGAVRALVRQAGRIVRLDGQRPPAGRAPWMARVNPDPACRLKNRPDGRFFALGKNYPFMSKREGENPHRVRAEQLAAMKDRRPPRRGEQCTGESSFPHRQTK